MPASPCTVARPGRRLVSEGPLRATIWCLATDGHLLGCVLGEGGGWNWQGRCVGEGLLSWAMGLTLGRPAPVTRGDSQDVTGSSVSGLTQPWLHQGRGAVAGVWGRKPPAPQALAPWQHRDSGFWGAPQGPQSLKCQQKCGLPQSQGHSRGHPLCTPSSSFPKSLGLEGSAACPRSSASSGCRVR